MFERRGKATAMKKAVALILVVLLLDGPENVALLAEMLSPREAGAADWMCGQDLNGNGYVGDPGETAQCIPTPQGQLCPIGSANCAPTQTCPLGTYPCTGGTCTQTGICSPTQVQVTQYRCPATGRIYPDQTTCSNNCLQSAPCTVAVLSGSAQFPMSEPSQCGISPVIPPTAYLGSLSFSGEGSQLTITGNYNKPDSNGCDGSCGDACSYAKTSTITIGGASLSGSGSFPMSEPSQCGSSLLSHPAAFLISISFSGSGNQVVITGNYNKPDSNGCDGSCGDACSYTRTSRIVVGGALCPLSGGSTCSGIPPACTAKQACVTVNSTVTVYQCSLSGTQYSTLDQCTSNCSKTAGCSTGYACPSGSQYPCMNNSGVMQCSANVCVDTTNSGDITHVDDTMLQDDGPRDESGNCLGMI
jgi:hypothetical protein